MLWGQLLLLILFRTHTWSIVFIYLLESVHLVPYTVSKHLHKRKTKYVIDIFFKKVT